MMNTLINYLIDNKYFFPFIYFLFISLRYLLVSSLAYFLLWKVFAKKLAKRKIQHATIKQGQIKKEIYYSLLSYIAVSLSLSPLFYLFIDGKTAISLDADQLTISRIILSIVIFFLWHDLSFYWSHKWLHTKWAFKKIHYIHHSSRTPTPYDSNCFHWFEGVLQNLFLYPLVLFVPMHPWTLIGLMSITQVFSAWGHFNYELMPFKTWGSWWGSWVTTSTHHNFHHKYNKGNLALYFKFWDKAFKTLDSRTEQRFDEFNQS